MIFKILASRQKNDGNASIEILPPETSRRVVPKEKLSADEMARRAGDKAGSIIGGAVAGFTTGVARHTVTPIVQGVAQAGRNTVGFVKSILLGVFVVALSLIGLLAFLLASAPRR